MSIKNKLFSNTISSGLQFGSRWLVNLMLAQSLVLSEFGIFSFVYSVSIILATFFSFGSNLYLLKEIGEIKNYDDKIMTFIKSLIITVILFLSFLIVYLLCFYIFASLYKELIYGILLGFIFSINSNIYYFFKGLGFFDKEAKAYFIFSIILLFVFSVLYYNNSLSMLSVESIFAILIIVNFVPLILGIRYLKNDISFHVFKSIVQKLFHYKNVLFEFKKRFVYGLHELQSILFANLPTILIGILSTPIVLGHYRAIYLLITPILILPTIISQVLLNQLAISKDNISLFKKTFRKFLIFSLLLGIVFVILYILFGKNIIEFLYKEKFDTEISLKLLYIFVFSSFLWFIKSNYEVLITALNKQGIRVNVLWFMLVLYPLLVLVLPIDLVIYRYAYAGLFTTILMLIIYIIFAEFGLRYSK